MSDHLILPPERDLPRGRLEARREHLLSEIVLDDRRRSSSVLGRLGGRGLRRASRPVAVSIAVAGVAAVLVLAIGIVGDQSPQLTGPAAAQAAIEVSTVSGWYEIRVTELAEGTERAEDELQQLGLPVEFDFVPVSPSLEGTLVASSGGDGREEFVEPDGLLDSPPAIRVPVDYSAELHLTIGRPASSEEDYTSTPALGAEVPGEALHGSRIFNMPVRDALDVLQGRGLTAEWRDEGNSVRDSVELLDSYVTEAVPKAPGEVIVWTALEPQLPDPRSAEVREALGY